MTKQLVPQKLLYNVDKILFVTHLAIGDFTYMQTYFKAFAKRYPHIKIHVWVDEVRRTRCWWKWNSLKNYALYSWLESCSFIHKVYKKTYSPQVLKPSIRDAQSEGYPIVVSLTSLRSDKYARLARTISPQGFVVGCKSKTPYYSYFKNYNYKKLDASFFQLPRPLGHITDEYAAWFEQLFGLVMTHEERRPAIELPEKLIASAQKQSRAWGIDKDRNPFQKVFYLNSFAKTEKRSWPLEKLVLLIEQLQKKDQLENSVFIVNVIPSQKEAVKTFFASKSLSHIFLFTAEKNFLELPAIISLCDFVISVETSVIHLASALNVPVVALMRQKNPEWAPWDKDKSIIVTTKKRNQWIADIQVEDVCHALSSTF